MDHNTIENRDSDSETDIHQEPLPMAEGYIHEVNNFPSGPSPEQRSNEIGIERKDVCACASDKGVVTSESNSDEQAHCPYCGKEMEQSNSGSCSLQFSDSRETTSAGGTDPPSLFLGEAFANVLPLLPDTPEPSLEANSIGEGDENATGQRIHSVVEQNTPVHGYSDTSVQIPPIGTQFTFYVLQHSPPSTNEQWLTVHFFDPEDSGREGNVSTWIKTMEEQLGYKLHLVAIGEEFMSLEENQPFHTAFVDNHITIKFELVKQVHSKFRIRNSDPANEEVPLSRIQCLSQNRIFPGAIAKVFVESLAEPGELCQDHLRMTLVCGNTKRTMLIPIWSAGQP